jgi:hypothetical protein
VRRRVSVHLPGRRCWTAGDPQIPAGQTMKGIYGTSGADELQPSHVG